MSYQTASDASGSFSVNNIVPGTYYVEAYRDNNNAFDSGDFLVYYGTTATFDPNNASRLSLAAGATENITLRLFEIP